MKKLLLLSFLPLSLITAMKKDSPNERLLAAALRGDLTTVEQSLEAGADVNFCQNNTPLLAALERDHFSIVRHLLTKGANTNLAPTDNLPPLVVAAKRSCDLASFNLILKHRADVNRKDAILQWTPLMWVVGSGKLYDTIEVRKCTSLLEAGAEINLTQCSTGETALIILLKKHGENEANPFYFELLNLFLQRKADPNLGAIKDRTPMKALTYAKRVVKNQQIIDALILYNATE